MAGVGFELKKIFKDNASILNSLKGYSITAIVTEGPMILTIIMLFVLRYIMKYQGASYKNQEIFLFLLTYVMVFSLIISNTVLMFVNRYISDCIYNNILDEVLPSFFGVITLVLGCGDAIAFTYLLTLPLSWGIRIIVLIQFSSMLVLWIQIAYLSAIKQYTYVLLGFLSGTVFSILGSIIMSAIGMDHLISALSGAMIGFLIMMFFFMTQMLAYYPLKQFHIFRFLSLIKTYRILIVTGFFMAFGLYAHNFVHWFSEFQNKVFSTGVYCVRYDIPSFFATLTIIPLQVQFVVSLETNFSVKNREYFDVILHGGRLSDIRIAKKDMQKTLYRELAHMMQIQLIFTVLSITLIGNMLGRIGLNHEMLEIFRLMCFGYCIYGLVKSLLIVLLYFDDRKGACFNSILFAILSLVLSAVVMNLGIENWGAGFVCAGIVTSCTSLWRLSSYLKKLEYHVFCEQPLFVLDNKKTRIQYKKTNRIKA